MHIITLNSQLSTLNYKTLNSQFSTLNIKTLNLKTLNYKYMKKALLRIRARQGFLT